MNHLNYFRLKNGKTKTIILALLVSAVVSCKKKDKDEETPADNPNAYVMALRAQGTGTTTTDFVIKSASLMEGELSAVGNGIEQAGWNYYMTLGNTLLSVNYGDEGTIGYKLNSSGNLQESGRFWAENMDCFGKADEQNAIIVGAPWGGGSYDCELMVVNADKMAITSRKSHRLYVENVNDTLNKWPTASTGRDGKIYISFYPLDGDTWDTPKTDSAYVSIYKYPSLEYVTTIKDPRTSPIGLYGAIPSMFTTESGDIYTMSSSSIAAGYTQATKPSGFLRIKKGQDQFDPAYFFNFQQKNNAKLVMANYMGNNKVLVRYISVAADAAAKPWDIYEISAPLCKLGILDLTSETLTPLTGIPDHGNGYGGNLYMENGKAYISISSAAAAEVRVYEIDPATAAVKKGALVKGLEIPIITKLHN
jgi:hypothetical protein